MTANTVVRARIDENVKEEASAVLAAMGLSVSDAMRMLLTRVARERALPIELLTPNPVTVQAMLNARQGKTVKVGRLDALIADLHADD